MQILHYDFPFYNQVSETKHGLQTHVLRQHDPRNSSNIATKR